MVDDLITAAAIAKLDYDAFLAEAGQFQQRQTQFADRCLQSLMLVNGGALVALFTLIGSKANLHVNPVALWTSFAFFAGGMAFTLAATFAAFFVQGFYYKSTIHQAWNAQLRAHHLDPKYDVNTPFRRGAVIELVGIGVASLALVAFLVGCWFAFNGVIPA